MNAIRKAAEAIANARIMRRGSPPIANVWDMLPQKLRDEVTEDATAALEAAGPVNREEVVRALRAIQDICKREQSAMTAIQKDGHIVAIDGVVCQILECFRESPQNKKL